jgi:FkbM family methyltransferase
MRLEEIGHYRKLRQWVEDPRAVLAFRKQEQLGETLEVPFLDGRRLQLRSGTADFFIFREVFLRDEYALDDRGPGLDTVIDLGANVGFFSFRVAPLAKRVIGYEASEENFRQLQWNLADCGQVESVHEAVAREAGSLRLYSPSGDGSHAQRSMYGDGQDYEDVPATTLDALFERHDVQHCDFMKIDVEGAEYDILFGASAETLGAIGRIHGEYHNLGPDRPGHDIDGLSDFLGEHGFDVRVDPHPKNPGHGIFVAQS